MGETLIIMYSATDDSNLLTNERVANIHDIEARIRSASGYKQFCRLGSGGQCMPPSSIVNFMYPSIVSGNVIADGLGQEVDVPAAVVLLLQLNRGGFFSYHYGE